MWCAPVPMAAPLGFHETFAMVATRLLPFRSNCDEPTPMAQPVVPSPICTTVPCNDVVGRCTHASSVVPRTGANPEGTAAREAI